MSGFRFEVIGFDADDTLWHNEDLFDGTQARFKQMLAAYHEPAWIAERLYRTELANLRYFGYGVKSYTLSMVETAIELTEGRISGAEIAQIMGWGKDMLQAPVRLLDGVEAVVRALAGRRLMLVTKGDLFDQENKIARSGLAECFTWIEIVSAKTPQTYAELFAKYDIDPQRFLMVGNSPNSDILPVIEAGGRALHVPYHTTWAHEEAEGDFPVLAELAHLPAWLEATEASS
jgi:putative hydrolase of the HAD superfamily